MKKETVDTLETLISKVEGAYKELSVLSKKSPNDAVNNFKLKIINNIISQCNEFLGKKNMPIDGFELFDEDDVPTNSDLIFVITQYSEALEQWRSDVISHGSLGWCYTLKDGTEIRTSMPAKLKR